MGTRGRRLTYLTLAVAAACGLWALSTTDPAQAAQADGNPQVVIDTTMGPITVELDPAKAPITVENFLKYVDDGFYNGLIFHRVISDFMIQGGGMDAQLKEKETRAPIKLEVGKGLSNTRGTIAMARTSNPNSATAQFFINLFDKNTILDQAGGGYAVFGKVVAGMENVDKIAAVRTGNKGGHENVPVEPVYIKSAKRKAKS
jgi:peptidyl-prolyl cis-trans isomerase A (cyclophilin A)